MKAKADDPAKRELPLQQILSRLKVANGPNCRGEYTCWCIFHKDGEGQPPHRPNLSVSERGYYCHVCKQGGTLPKLADHLGLVPPPTPRRKPSAVYDYRDETGDLVFQSSRYPGKTFGLRQPDGKGGWEWHVPPEKRILYRLPDIVRDPEAMVFVVEGEKDADERLQSQLRLLRHRPCDVHGNDGG